MRWVRVGTLLTTVVLVFSAVLDAANRIVSIAPNLTEILFAIGAGDQVAAVSDYCRYPESANSKPRIGGPFNLSYERILALRPDLVLLPRSLVGVAEKCRSLGLTTLELPNERVDEVLSSIVRLGEVTGRSSEAGALAEKIRVRLDEVEKLTRDLPRTRALIVVLRSVGSLQDLTVASEDTFLHELVWRAGGANVIGHTLARYPLVSKEQIIELDPDVILDLTFTTEKEDTQAVWAQIPSLTAVRERRVVALPDPSVTIPGPRMVDTLGRFLQILHPGIDPPRAEGPAVLRAKDGGSSRGARP